MKILFTILLTSITFNCILAKSKINSSKVSIGIEANMGPSWTNRYAFYSEFNNIYSSGAIFTGGLGINVPVKLSNNFSIIPGIFYSVYGSLFTIPADGVMQTSTSSYGKKTTSQADFKEELSIHYFQFPLLLQARIPIKDNAIYFETGASLAARIYSRFAKNSFDPAKTAGELEENWEHQDVTDMTSGLMGMFHFNTGYIGNMSSSVSYKIGLNYSHGLTDIFGSYLNLNATTKAVQLNLGLLFNLKSR